MWLSTRFAAHGRRATPRRRTRLTVEPLEGRSVPANFTAATAAELIAAVSASNDTPGADTITLRPGTTFTLTAVNNDAHGAAGFPAVGGAGLTIVGNGSVIERAAAAGTPAFRLFSVAAGGSLRLENLTLQGGLAWWAGGAVYNLGTLALAGVTVQNNTACGPYDNDAAGGGIHSVGSLTVDGCTIRNNLAVGGRGFNTSGDKGDKVDKDVAGSGGWGSWPPNPDSGRGGDGLGGGVYVGGGTALIRNTTLAGNTARGGDGGDGGGDGGDGLGGGLYAAGGTVTLRDTSVTDNAARGRRGGGNGGDPGRGVGGGLYIAPDAWIGLDASTESQVRRNSASTSHNNIAGAYEVIS